MHSGPKRSPWTPNRPPRGRSSSRARAARPPGLGLGLLLVGLWLGRGLLPDLFRCAEVLVEPAQGLLQRRPLAAQLRAPALLLTLLGRDFRPALALLRGLGPEPPALGRERRLGLLRAVLLRCRLLLQPLGRPLLGLHPRTRLAERPLLLRLEAPELLVELALTLLLELCFALALGPLLAPDLILQLLLPDGLALALAQELRELLPVFALGLLRPRPAAALLAPDVVEALQAAEGQAARRHRGLAHILDSGDRVRFRELHRGLVRRLLGVRRPRIHEGGGGRGRGRWGPLRHPSLGAEGDDRAGVDQKCNRHRNRHV
mmetsp:Transcript_101735/g.287998  ORF Transcript_101735/g.287998 Transcript_101735/m.287998 type:complete len:317 (+) Transcript_101735:112-1062(+)